ncbi:MAG: hypothetical protein HYZ27_09380, partial [Deltaproteobacteria bacterium]|nr:hypothetical protein [Deltaproteobacteria bacterium]
MRAPRSQRGQAMVEYGMLALMAAAALFMPVLPDPDGGRTSFFLLSVKVFDIYINSF